MKVKIFVNEGDAPELERQINAWVAQNRNIEVLHIKQSYAYDGEHYMDALVSVWYLENGSKKQ